MDDQDYNLAPTRLPTCFIWSESPRAGRWRDVFGRMAGVPIQSYATVNCGVPGHSSEPCYLLDLSRLSIDERLRLIAYLCVEYGMTPAQVEYEMRDDGVPILATDVVAIAPLPLFVGVMS